MESTPKTAPAQDVQTGKGLSIGRYFTTAGMHPFDAVEWESRDARIGHGDRVAFELIEDSVSGPRATAVRRGARSAR